MCIIFSVFKTASGICKWKQHRRYGASLNDQSRSSRCRKRKISKDSASQSGSQSCSTFNCWTFFERTGLLMHIFHVWLHFYGYFSVQLVAIERFQLWWGLSTFYVEIFSDDEPKASQSEKIESWKVKSPNQELKIRNDTI